MIQAKRKPKKCRNQGCENTFTPWSTTEKVCSVKCALDLVAANKAKEDKADLRKRKRELKDNDRSHQRKRAQYWFNRYIRLRDREEPCISCQRHHEGQYHAGHYRSRGAASHLAFNEFNTNRQCRPCNELLSGNITDYRINLVKKIGLELVEQLENDNSPRKFTIEEFKRIQAMYKFKCREIEGTE